MLGIYITAGYPNAQTTTEALKALDADSSVSIIELGVPFSDPVADGPVIQAASYQALQQGMNLDKIFTLFKEAEIKTDTILFSYFNPLNAYGFDNLIEKCKETGIRGALIPDLPIEEAEKLITKFKEAGLDLILLAAVTSTDERLEQIAKLSNPWIYLVSRTGVTGSNKPGQSFDLKSIISKLKSHATEKKVAIGFGIDSPEKVQAAYDDGADIAIIGTKAVKILDENGAKGLQTFISGLSPVSK